MTNIKDQLNEHQQINLAYVVQCYRAGVRVEPSLINMSVLAALMRRGLVLVVPTIEAQSIAQDCARVSEQAGGKQ